MTDDAKMELRAKQDKPPPKVKLRAFDHDCIEVETPNHSLLMVQEQDGQWIAGKRNLPDRMREKELAQFIHSLVLLHQQLRERNKKEAA